LQLTDEERSELETQLCDKARKKAEINMMKVIHDLKNPIQAIEELIGEVDDVKEVNTEEKENSNQSNKITRRMTLNLDANNN